MSKTTIGLSPGRKTWMVVEGVAWLIVGNLIAMLLMRLQDGFSIDSAAIFIIFGILGVAPIFRALGSRLEFNGNEIRYVQPLFRIVCKWDDFVGLRVSSEGVSLRFLDSRMTTFRFIARSLHRFGFWNNTIPLSPFLTLDNRMKIWDIIERYLEEDQEKKILALLLTG